MATTTAARRAGIRFPAWRADVAIVGIAALLLAYLTVVPLAMLVLGALSASGSALDFQFTTRYLERVLTDQASLELLANSLMYASGSAALAFAIGTGVAWAVERTNVPARSLWYGIALVPLIVPGIVHTIAWLFLLSPEIGWINAPLKALFGFSMSVYSLPGMIWIEGLHTAPLAFILMSAAFRAMDRSREEAAAGSRANAWKTFSRVTLPLLLPSVASVLLILFVRALEGFEVPAIIGIPGRIFVYTSRIYLSLKLYPPSFGLAAAYGLVLLAISVVGLVLHRRATRRIERYTTVTGKAYRPRRLELGRFRYVALAGLGLYAFLAIVLVAYVTRYLPYGIRGASSAIIQVPREPEEAAAAAGARWWPTFRLVLLPLLRPALVGTWIYIFIVSLRELGSSVLLYSTQSVVLAVRIFDLRDSGNYTSIAALSIFLIVILVILVTVLQRLGGRTTLEAQPCSISQGCARPSSRTTVGSAPRKTSRSTSRRDASSRCWVRRDA